MEFITCRPVRQTLQVCGEQSVSGFSALLPVRAGTLFAAWSKVPHPVKSGAKRDRAGQGAGYAAERAMGVPAQRTWKNFDITVFKLNDGQRFNLSDSNSVHKKFPVFRVRIWESGCFLLLLQRYGICETDNTDIQSR
ncbi:MAG: hypothetical protein LBE91_02600 [Tannerella sp.]|jgi:hypothetical protein|nr:hypothetical protein [Tannerella sp.]